MSIAGGDCGHMCCAQRHNPYHSHDIAPPECTSCAVQRARKAELHAEFKRLAVEVDKLEAERAVPEITPADLPAKAGTPVVDLMAALEESVKAAKAERFARQEITPAEPPGYVVDPLCIVTWPECEEGKYDPRCCRFPKSCSCWISEEHLAIRRAASPREEQP